MFQLDEAFLESVGLGGMPDEQKQPFLEYLYEQLEINVGAKLSEGMSDAQLTEFQRIAESRDDQAAVTWLETHRPQYRNVVADELDKLKKELIAQRDAILGIV
jgi:hypothetical protein